MMVGYRQRNVRIALIAASVLALGLYLNLLVSHTAYVAGGFDSSGYLNEARGFAEGRVIRQIPIFRSLNLDPAGNPWLFTPLGYVPGPEPGTMAPFYPPGLPLHLALFGLVGGWSAGPFLVAPLCAALSAVLIYLLSRQTGLSVVSSFCSSVMLAVCSVFIFQAIQPMSDVVATLYALLAIFAALRAQRSSGWAIVAGAAFGMGVLVRPTNILVAIPFIIALGLQPGRLILAGLGALPFAATMMGINALSYGNPLNTGYGSVMSGVLELPLFKVRSWHYFYWLLALMSLLVMPGGLFVAVVPEVSRRIRALLLLWFLPFYLFYCFYWPYETWWYTRFLLPALPALIIGSLLMLEAVERRCFHTPFGLIPIMAATIVVLTNVEQLKKEHVLEFGISERVYIDAATLVREKVPPRALVVAMQHSGSLLYYAHRNALRYDLIQPDRFAELQANAFTENFDWYALIAKFELEEFRRRMPGQWRPIAQVRDVTLFHLEPR